MNHVNNPPQYEANVYAAMTMRAIRRSLDRFLWRQGFRDARLWHPHSNNIKFVFEYPDGPFLNTFTWNPEKKSWTFLMQQKDPAGKWTMFAEDTVVRQ